MPGRRGWGGSGRTSGVLLLGAALTCAGIALAAQLTGVLRPLERRTVDARFSVRGAQAPPRDVVVVGVDDDTFTALIDYPLNRRANAYAIKILRRLGARAIVYDLDFTQGETRADSLLIKAVRDARRQIVISPEVFGRSSLEPGRTRLRAFGVRAADAAQLIDSDGVVRRLRRSAGGLDSFAVAAVEIATGRNVSSSRFRSDGTAWIDFAGPPGTVPEVSMSEILRREPDLEVLGPEVRGRIAVVGVTALALRDRQTTSAGGGQMTRPEILANAIHTVAAGLPLREAPASVVVLCTILAACILPLAALRLRALWILILAAALFAAWCAAAQLAFGADLILPAVAPLTALSLSLPLVLGVSYATAAGERQRMRDLFSRFVPVGVVDDVLARADDDLRLGGRRLESTIVFCDLRGSTAFAEKVDAETVLDVLNRFLEEMTGAVMAHEGTLVSYQGDGLLAVFGAPIEQIDHADRALDAVREMTGVRLQRFNAWVREQGLGDGFRIGVGINSGVVLAGNVGSAERLAYTAVGDTVNTAARLETMTKGTAHQVLLSEATRSLLQRARSDLEFVDSVEVRGRAAKVQIWTLA